MKCLGFNRNLRKCSRDAVLRGFCHDHSRQPILWFCFLVFTVLAGTFQIVSYIRPSQPVFVPIETRIVETKTVQPTPNATVQPTPQSSVTPAVTPLKKDTPKDDRSSHLRKAKALYAQGKYQEALGECDAELLMNPRNNEALILRKRISRTIEILSQ